MQFRLSRRRGRRLPPGLALIALALLASLGNAPGASAQAPGVAAGQAVEAIVGGAPAAPASAQTSQLAEQVAAVAQAATADAVALQPQPINVAAPAVIASPGSRAVVQQANDVVAPAAATNANAISQAADQSPRAGGSAEPLPGASAPGQPADQGAHAGQVAAAQAIAAQHQPVNIAIPIIVDSPNSHAAVVQANNAAAAATVENSGSISQSVTQTQPGGAASGDPGASAPGAPGEIAGRPQGGSVAQLVQGAVAPPAAPLVSVSVWIWNRTFPETIVPDVVTGVRLPRIPGVGLGSVWPGIDLTSIFDEAASIAEDLASSVTDAIPTSEVASVADTPIVGSVGVTPGIVVEHPVAGARFDRRSSTPETGVPADGPWAESGSSLSQSSSRSSGFVQTPATEPTSRERRIETAEGSLPVPLPRRSVPAGSGGLGVSPFGFVLGALFLLALQLASAAFALGRRFDLASAAWRRQAYLSPLERPG